MQWDELAAWLRQGAGPPGDERARQRAERQRADVALLFAELRGSLPDPDDEPAWERAVDRAAVGARLPGARVMRAAAALKAYAAAAAPATQAPPPRAPDEAPAIPPELLERINRAARSAERQRGRRLTDRELGKLVHDELGVDAFADDQVARAQRAVAMRKGHGLLVAPLLHLPTTAAFDRLRDRHGRFGAPDFDTYAAHVRADGWFAPYDLVVCAHLLMTRFRGADAARRAGAPIPDHALTGIGLGLRATTKHGVSGKHDSQRFRDALRRLSTIPLEVLATQSDEWEHWATLGLQRTTVLSLVELLCHDGLWRSLQEIDEHPDGWRQVRGTLGRNAHNIRFAFDPQIERLALAPNPRDRERDHIYVGLDALTWLPAGDVKPAVALAWRAPKRHRAEHRYGLPPGSLPKDTPGVLAKAWWITPKLMRFMGFFDPDHRRCEQRLLQSFERIAHTTQGRLSNAGQWEGPTRRAGVRRWIGVEFDPACSPDPSPAALLGTAPSRQAWACGGRERTSTDRHERSDRCRRAGRSGARRAGELVRSRHRRRPSAAVRSSDDRGSPDDG